MTTLCHGISCLNEQDLRKLVGPGHKLRPTGESVNLEGQHISVSTKTYKRWCKFLNFARAFAVSSTTKRCCEGMWSAVIVGELKWGWMQNLVAAADDVIDFGALETKPRIDVVRVVYVRMDHGILAQQKAEAVLNRLLGQKEEAWEAT